MAVDIKAIDIRFLNIQAQRRFYRDFAASGDDAPIVDEAGAMLLNIQLNMLPSTGPERRYSTFVDCALQVWYLRYRRRDFDRYGNLLRRPEVEVFDTYLDPDQNRAREIHELETEYREVVRAMCGEQCNLPSEVRERVDHLVNDISGKVFSGTMSLASARARMKAVCRTILMARPSANPA